MSKVLERDIEDLKELIIQEIEQVTTNHLMEVIRLLEDHTSGQ